MSEGVAAHDYTVVASGIQPLTSPESSTLAGLVGGLPATTTGEFDILSLWLRLYRGDMQQHLAEINAAGLRNDHRFKAITEFEWVRLWGIIIGARQFSEKGKELWSIMSHGLREALDYERFMKAHMFETIRRHVRDCFSVSAPDAWALFRLVIEGFNGNRARVMHHNYDKTFDESMSSYQPRKDKLGGLPNISFIERKPKPMGTEFKTACDSETCVMTFMEIQEGKERMQRARHAQLPGVTAACTLRLTKSCKP
jgi:hypothetical protein